VTRACRAASRTGSHPRESSPRRGSGVIAGAWSARSLGPRATDGQSFATSASWPCLSCSASPALRSGAPASDFSTTRCRSARGRPAAACHSSRRSGGWITAPAALSEQRP
jgi:hypothetical protein